MITHFHPYIFFCLVTLTASSAVAGAQDIIILVNHLGYEQDAPIHVVIRGHDADSITTVELVDDSNGEKTAAVDAKMVGRVDQWSDWCFWTADFPPVARGGAFHLECVTPQGQARSFPFRIEHDLLERNTLSNVIYYFKSQRCSGSLDKADHNLLFQDSTATADVHGGWYDATGDYGKHLSHLSFSTYFNPQQIPFTDWCLFKAYALLNERDILPEKNFRQYKRRLLDEAMFGADYLVRVKNPNGSFYRSVDGPGGEKKPEDRRIAKESNWFTIKTVATKNNLPNGDNEPASSQFPYEVGYRNGGGVAIAALAVASTCDVCGEFSNAQYLTAAQGAFDFLEKHNLQYTNDGRENIVDDYCALLAATELFKATKSAISKAAADSRANRLMDRLTTTGEWRDYWRADDRDRPFFHAADAGLPIISLLTYYHIAESAKQSRVLDTVRKSLEFEMRTTSEVANPFGYARQLLQSIDGKRRTAFFYPHDTETAPWWQGENARLGSLAAAARMAAPYFNHDSVFQMKLTTYAWNQLNWILGLNPFDACMLQGAGHGNIPYMFFSSYEYTNAPGGICNGITGGLSNPHDIAFNLGFSVTGKDEDWRWGEQWLPHASWYLLAVALNH